MTAAAIDLYNRAFYEQCWRVGSLITMPGVQMPRTEGRRRVEIGCGLRPRLALHDAVFVDVSPSACVKLHAAGATAVRAAVEGLPFASGSIREVYLFDVLEHVHDDASVVRELGRVVGTGGWLVLSTPLHARWWHEYDRAVGHARRYEPRALIDLLQNGGFQLQAFAPFGMRPRSALLTRLGAYYLVHWPKTALRFQERFLRWVSRNATPLALQWAGVAEFLAAAAAADGAVTAWRRE